MPQLPPWVSYLQALAVPIIGAIIALFSVWIAARQMWIAQRKLDHDIFYMQYEKRFAVYEATRKVLANVFHGNLSDDDIRVYGLCTLDAQFLFDDDEVTNISINFVSEWPDGIMLGCGRNSCLRAKRKTNLRE